MKKGKWGKPELRNSNDSVQAVPIWSWPSPCGPKDESLALDLIER